VVLCITDGLLGVGVGVGWYWWLGLVSVLISHRQWVDSLRQSAAGASIAAPDTSESAHERDGLQFQPCTSIVSKNEAQVSLKLH